MPIKNLTDRQTLKPSFPRLGKLRKGGEQKTNKEGKKIFGDDLEYFRFTSHNPDVVEAFNEIYGNEPRIVNAVMCYHTYEECFSSWIECWDASGLVFRSDGEHWVIWREDDKYKRGKRAHTDGKGQSEVGRLEFIIPELWDMGFRGTVTLETHSNHDLRNIGGVLLMAEENSETLRSLPFVLRRVQEEISTPGWGDRKGQRSRTEKWLVKLEPPRQLMVLETPLLAASVDDVTGEIVDIDQVARDAEKDFPATGPQNKPQKWYEFAELAVKELGFKAPRHVANALCKILEQPAGYKPFNNETGEVIGIPNKLWTLLAEHQAAKSNPPKPEVK